MAEGTYEHECMRAELLGVGAPDYEEFLQRKREAEENQRLAAEAELEAIETETLQNVELEGEALKGAGGKLDELNSILSATQKKLDRFKVRCGSVTELIRTKIGNTGLVGGANDSSDAASQPEPDGEREEEAASVAAPAAATARQADLDDAMDNHVDKLDGMLGKAQRAEIALRSQNERIRKLLK